MTRPAAPLPADAVLTEHALFTVPLAIETVVDELVRSDFDAEDFDARR